ncbi:hypothetical protein A989_15692, partial [Xanthomonas translucens DAR61454]
MIELPSADDVTQASQQLGLAASAAELHGALCGWLAGGGANLAAWPAAVLADAGIATPRRGDVLD